MSGKQPVEIEAGGGRKEITPSAATVGSTWFIGQTLPCKFDASKAMLVLDVITTHEALQKSYRKTFWMKRKVWEEKHQRALDEHNEALARPRSGNVERRAKPHAEKNL